MSAAPADPGLITAVRVLARLSRVLAHTDTGLSVPQYRTLALISRGDERSSRLAEQLAVAKPTVTSMVDGLVAAGLLERMADPADRRASTLRLTPAGGEALARADAILGKRLEPVFADVSDRDRLVELLGEIGRALDAGRHHGSTDAGRHHGSTDAGRQTTAPGETNGRQRWGIGERRDHG